MYKLLNKQALLFLTVLCMGNYLISSPFNHLLNIFSVENIKKRFQKSPAEINRLRYIEKACEQFDWNQVVTAGQEQQFKRWSELYVASQLRALYMKTVPLTLAAWASGLAGRYTNNNIKYMFYSAALLCFSYTVIKGIEHKIKYEEPLDIIKNDRSSPADRSKAFSKFLYYNLSKVRTPQTEFPTANAHNVQLHIANIADTANLHLPNTHANPDRRHNAKVTEWNWRDSIHNPGRYCLIVNGNLNTMFNAFKEL